MSENSSGNFNFLFEFAPEMILQEMILKLESDVLFTMPISLTILTRQIFKHLIFQMREFYMAFYSGLPNKRTLCIYLFHRKILPCAALFHSSEQYYDSPVCLFIFGKIPCPVRLFHTVQLLDSPE